MPDKWLEYLVAKPPVLPILILLLAVVVFVGFIFMVGLSRASLRNIHAARAHQSRRESKYDARLEEANRQQQAQADLLQQMVNLLTKQNELLGQTLSELRKISGNQAP